MHDDMSGVYANVRSLAERVHVLELYEYYYVVVLVTNWRPRR